jgi:hypothetical protein
MLFLGCKGVGRAFRGRGSKIRRLLAIKSGEQKFQSWLEVPNDMVFSHDACFRETNNHILFFSFTLIFMLQFSQLRSCLAVSEQKFSTKVVELSKRIALIRCHTLKLNLSQC